jgi:hypothetical protein
MTERLNVTTNNIDSPVFSPGSDFYVQMSTADSAASVDVLARVDAAADWVVLDTLSTYRPIGYFAALPFVKLKVKDNNNQRAVKAWTSP